MLCYSTASLPDAFDARRIAEALLPTPFRGVEYVLRPEDLPRADDASRWRAFRLELETRGLTVRNVQLGHPFLLGPVAHSPGLSALNPVARARRVEACLAAARVAEHLGSPYLTITTGLPEPGNEDGGGDSAAQEAAFDRALAELVRRRPRGLKLAIEQEPEHVIRSAEQVLRACRAFDGEVFANYDIGHGAVLGENPADAVRLLGDHVSNLHFEDIRAREHRHLLFGDGDIDFRAVFTALRDIRYAGDLTPDLYPFKDEAARALRESATFFARMLRG